MMPISATLVSRLQEYNLQIRTAESCTGGLIMAALTDISGASSVVDRGIVSYSNEAKKELLGVNEYTLSTYGAVSAEVAFEMVKGISGSPSVAALSVTGVAGPGGGTAEKPVGTVWIGALVPNKEPIIKHYLFDGDRSSIRHQTVEAACAQLLSLLD